MKVMSHETYLKRLDGTGDAVLCAPHGDGTGHWFVQHRSLDTTGLTVGRHVNVDLKLEDAYHMTGLIISQLVRGGASWERTLSTSVKLRGRK